MSIKTNPNCVALEFACIEYKLKVIESSLYKGNYTFITTKLTRPKEMVNKVEIKDVTKADLLGLLTSLLNTSEKGENSIKLAKGLVNRLKTAKHYTLS